MDLPIKPALMFDSKGKKVLNFKAVSDGKFPVFHDKALKMERK